MSIFHHASHTPVGIDIGAGRIKAAQLARTRAGWRVSAAVAVERQEHTPVPTDAEIARLVDVLMGIGVSAASVVLGAPRAHLHTAVLDLPPRCSGAPVEQICGAEAARMFRLSPGTYEMHAWEVPTASEHAASTQMAVSALECAQAESLVGAFEGAGLQVEAIDLAGEALVRACAPACSGPAELTALVDIGYSGVDLAVYRGGEAVYERWLAGRGLGRIAETVSKSLAIDDRAAQLLLRRVGLRGIEGEGIDSIALARLLSLTREYAEHLLHQVLGSVVYVLDRFHGESVTHLRLTGGGSTIPELDTYLTELSGLDVRRIGPRACGVACADDQDRPEFMVALGHALWRAA